MVAKYSADPYHTYAYSADMRWGMVYQCEGLGLPCRQVASNLNVDPSTVSRVVSRFNATGNVDVQPRSGAPMKLSAFDEFAIMDNVLKGLICTFMSYRVTSSRPPMLMWMLPQSVDS